MPVTDRVIVRVILLGALAALSNWGRPLAAADDTPQRISWLDDYGEALRQAWLTRRPIFLEFRCAP